MNELSNNIYHNVPKQNRIFHLKDYTPIEEYTVLETVPNYEYKIPKNYSILHSLYVMTNKPVSYAIRISFPDDIVGKVIMSITQEPDIATKINIPTGKFFNTGTLVIDFYNLEHESFEMTFHTFDFPEQIENDIVIFDNNPLLYNGKFKLLTCDNVIKYFEKTNNDTFNMSDDCILSTIVMNKENVNYVKYSITNNDQPIYRQSMFNSDIGCVENTQIYKIANNNIKAININDNTYYILQYGITTNHDVLQHIIFNNRDNIISCQLKFNNDNGINIVNINPDDKKMSISTFDKKYFELFVTINKESLDQWIQINLAFIGITMTNYVRFLTGQYDSNNGDIVEIFKTL